MYDGVDQVNPTGYPTGTSKILRGGAWDANDDDGRRIESRGWWVPPYYYNNGGLRIVTKGYQR
jgi:formylglycine-generating enzyme required for sulfatase activity